MFRCPRVRAGLVFRCPRVRAVFVEPDLICGKQGATGAKAGGAFFFGRGAGAVVPHPSAGAGRVGGGSGSGPRA